MSRRALARHFSINLAVGSEGFEKDGLAALMGNKFEDDPQVVTCACGPRVFELSAQFMGFQAGMEGVRFKKLQG